MLFPMIVILGWDVDLESGCFWIECAANRAHHHETPRRLSKLVADLAQKYQYVNKIWDRLSFL